MNICPCCGKDCKGWCERWPAISGYGTHDLARGQTRKIESHRWDSMEQLREVVNTIIDAYGPDCLAVDHGMLLDVYAERLSDGSMVHNVKPSQMTKAQVKREDHS